jgi:tetratricopeptide (TPR) repeat protein
VASFRRALAVLLSLAWIAWTVAPLAAQEQAEPPTAPAVRVLRTGGLKVESAALLVSGEQGGSLHVAVLPLFFPGDGGRMRVPILLEIDGATLLKGNTGDLLRVEICLYAISGTSAGTGSVEGSLLETIEADLPRAGAAIERSGLQYTGELSLAPGEYSLRALVRNALTGEVGLRILNLTVPDPKSGPLLLPPAFPNPSPDGWLAALSKTARSSPAALPDGSLPAAQPVLGIDQEARFELPVWREKWKAKAPDALRVDVLRPDGGRAAELPAHVESRRETAGLERLIVSFKPTGLEPGRYSLRAALPGTDALAWASPFVLLAEGGQGKVWAELLHGSAPREQTASNPPEVARPRGRKIDAGPVRAAYRKALQLLTAGDQPAARRAVAELEAPLLSGPKSAAPEDVADLELGVARDLPPQSLVPIALLHTALYRDAQQSREILRTTHSREMVLALAALYAERSREAARKRTAARLLLGLAAHLIVNAPPGLSERLFRQVLAFDEDNETARLYLAIEAESQGRYPEAVAHLERLLRSHPDHAEARLRLAVNLRRLGKPHDADRLLAGLTQGSTEPWVLALAYHETARSLLTAGRLDDAEKTLREGLKRLPGDEKLLLLLAEVFDLRHDPAQARQALAAFRPVHGQAESARRRYNTIPTEPLDRIWSGLVTEYLRPGS